RRAPGRRRLHRPSARWSSPGRNPRRVPGRGRRRRGTTDWSEACSTLLALAKGTQPNTGSTPACGAALGTRPVPARACPAGTGTATHQPGRSLPGGRSAGERLLELLLLLVRQVAGDDLELRRRLEGRDDPVGRDLADEQEQRRGPFPHRPAHRLDALPADAGAGEAPAERPHGRAPGGAEQRHEEEEAEQHPPERAEPRPRGGLVTEVARLRFLLALRPGHDRRVQ